MDFPQLHSVPMDIPIQQQYKNQIKICSALLRTATPNEVAAYAKAAQVLLVTTSNIEFIFQNFILSEADEDTLNCYIKKIIHYYNTVEQKTPIYKGQFGILIDGIRSQTGEAQELLSCAVKQEGDSNIEVQRTLEYFEIVKENIEKYGSIYKDDQLQQQLYQVEEQVDVQKEVPLVEGERKNFMI
ncbi:hypothetical protein SS50377_22669 [Spironucleus salmonicida]|uniref:Uncharacterized protein n=1 Tax=Spironucleus salmonicida TaxID=348837 RepID=V6M6F9_9EUKA|nr:hypothetical protein SS50377_22669 [Spironucleus salmonicida]|eukprot:EST48989.1 Hypothetical protein SS50377_10759 [Spironucleus salmonicida]